ncbi:uncharacterized protein [Apostichopus japonicus]|uniref:uncharacterized protein isoform X2 n=1 Tax=Stichopus japonicus TaxID=307972 RepID=UPI003AB607DB
MASSENSSPSKFLGKPWSVWATYALSQSTKDPVEISHAELGNRSLDSNSSPLPNEDDANVMKLKIEDKPMFGICPMRDECYLVFCANCEQYIKSQAMTKHYQLRHGRPPDRSPEPDFSSVQFPYVADHIPSHSSMPSSDSATIQSCAPLHRRSTPPLERLHSQEEVTKVPAPPEIRTESDSTPKHRKHQMAKPEPQLDEETIPAIASIEQDAPVTLTNEQTTYVVPHVVAPSPQLSSKSGNITDPYQVSSGGKSPLNHMLPMVKQESVSPSPYHRKEPSPSGASHISEKDSKKSITPPNASKPKKPASKKRSRKSSGIKNEKNIPCKDRQFDANKHCGVWSDDTKRPCTRSLTCKTHSLSLRRAVKGRRASFDEILAAHKKISDAERAAKLAGQQRDSKTNFSTSPKQASIQSSVKSETLQRHKSNQSSGLAQPKSSVVLNSSVPQKRSHNGATRHSNSTSAATVRVGASSVSHRSGEMSPLSHSQTTKVPAVLKSPPSEGPLVKGEADTHGSNAHNHTEQLHAGHPLPSTMCTFGAKTAGDGRHVFSRRMAPLRKAFLRLLEQQLNPQAASTKKQSRSQEQKHSAKLSRQSSAPASSKLVANSNISQLRTVDDSDLLSSAGSISDNIFRGTKSLKRPAPDTKANTSSKAQKVNQTNCMPQLQKSKVRRKSVTKISKMTQNITAANSTSSSSSSSSAPAAVTVTPNVVSVVPSNGFQAIDLSQGLYSIDATSEIPLSMLKNLRFVVTNIDTNANGGQNASQGGVAVPILSTVGSTQLVIGNVGGTVVPHDGKMNIKSRPKHTVGTKVALEKQAERSHRPSGQSQHVIVPNQYLISATESNTTVDKSAGQSIIIPSTTASGQVYRQNSSSAQVSSSLPNGIISNSSQVYTLKSLPTSMAMNCIQGSEKSPSRSSTPSPCANSTEPSPVGLHSHYTSGIQSQSAKNSSSKAVNNSQKPISKKPSGVALQAAPNVTATATQLPIQLQPLQFHQTTQLSQQIMANLIATDAQGKPVPILSANQHLLPSLSFQSGQSQVVQGMMTLAGDEGKGAQTTPLLQQQPALALSIPQQGTNPPVRLQGPGLSSTGGQSQSVLSSSSEVR